jgi:hypothetical protein
MDSLVKKATPTAAWRALTAPYRDKVERSDAARGKLEGRLRRAFDLFDEEMREVWGAETATDEKHGDNGAVPTAAGAGE